jgi:hypothetical protein
MNIIPKGKELFGRAYIFTVYELHIGGEIVIHVPGNYLAIHKADDQPGGELKRIPFENTAGQWRVMGGGGGNELV